VVFHPVLKLALATKYDFTQCTKIVVPIVLTERPFGGSYFGVSHNQKVARCESPVLSQTEGPQRALRQGVCR
jgi:hypothetical protein